MDYIFGEYIPFYEGYKPPKLKRYDRFIGFITQYKLLIISIILNLLYFGLIIYLYKNDLHVSNLNLIGIPLGLLLGVSIGEVIFE